MKELLNPAKSRDSNYEYCQKGFIRILWTLIIHVPCVCLYVYVESLFVNGNTKGLFFSSINKIRVTCQILDKKAYSMYL